MLVNYYSIKGCTYQIYENKPVIFAPDDVDTSSLTIQCYFIRTNDGRWCHYLTEKEYTYLMTFPKGEDVTFGDEPAHYSRKNTHVSNDDIKVNIICFFSLIFLIAGIIILFLEDYYFLLAVGFWIVSLVIIIIVRIHHPENTFGKIMSALCIIVMVALIFITIGGIIESVQECSRVISDCGSCIGSGMN